MADIGRPYTGATAKRGIAELLERLEKANRRAAELEVELEKAARHRHKQTGQFVPADDENGAPDNIDANVAPATVAKAAGLFQPVELVTYAADFDPFTKQPIVLKQGKGGNLVYESIVPDGTDKQLAKQAAEIDADIAAMRAQHKGQPGYDADGRLDMSNDTTL